MAGTRRPFSAEFTRDAVQVGNKVRELGRRGPPVVRKKTRSMKGSLQAYS